MALAQKTRQKPQSSYARASLKPSGSTSITFEPRTQSHASGQTQTSELEVTFILSQVHINQAELSHKEPAL